MIREQALLCPACGEPTLKVINSRAVVVEGCEGKWRRRRCRECQHAYTTYELPLSLLRKTFPELGRLGGKRKAATAPLE